MIKAIETRYKGYRFRSRLEARWAVFFDALNLHWEYEPEGFVLSDGRYYLPDFRVYTPQDSAIWYEIKPNKHADDGKMNVFKEDLLSIADPENNDFRKNFRKHEIDFPRFAILIGDPLDYIGVKGEKALPCPRCGEINTCNAAERQYIYHGYHAPCHPCDMETECGISESEKGVLDFLVHGHKGSVEFDNEGDYEFYIHNVVAAATRARQARFERGEAAA